MNAQPSLDLPPELARLVAMPPKLPAYQAGGMVGAGGQPAPMGKPGLAPQGQAQQSMSPQAMEAQINQFVSQNPEQVQQIQQAFLESMQSGELTPQELNMMIQLATVAAQNPEMYPNVRRFAIQQGIATEEDLPVEYDQGLVFVILLAAKSLQRGAGGQNMMQGGTPAAMPAMKAGGTVPQSKRNDGGVPIMAHEGEYVIPRHVVEMKGKEFFDNLIAKYSDKKKGKRSMDDESDDYEDNDD